MGEESRSARVGAELMFRGDAGWAFALYGRELRRDGLERQLLLASVDAGTFRLIRQHSLFGLDDTAESVGNASLQADRDVLLTLALATDVVESDGGGSLNELARRLRTRCTRWTRSALQRAASWRCLTLSQVAADGTRTSWTPGREVETS